MTARDTGIDPIVGFKVDIDHNQAVIAANNQPGTSRLRQYYFNLGLF